MTSDRKNSLNEINSSDHFSNDDSGPGQDKRKRRSSLVNAPWMNKIKPFIYGPKSDDVPDCYNRVRYIRDSCKVLSDLWKNDKDFLSKSIESDVSKSFKEFRQSEIARNYRSPYGVNGSPSILNRTIDDFVQIHDFIDSKRKESFEQFKKLLEQAKDKHTTIRQTITDLRDNYEKAQRKLETADGNLKKFQTRADRLTLANFDERCRELEDIRSECEQSRTLSRDIYTTEIYRISSEEHSITSDLFYQYLLEQNLFYNQISNYFSSKLPQIEDRLENDLLKPAFRSDLTKHCLKRSETTNTNIAYPIEICINLLKHHLREEGLFRIAASQVKQKKFLAELDLQSIDKTMTCNELGYDPHVPASTLKQYLRELPDCLLTSTLLSSWNEIPSISTEQGRLQRIAQLINQLPKVNYDNLCYLIRFLSCVAEYSSENKMTASNLGICIGCSLLYPKDQLTNTSMSNSYASASIILELMIIHQKQLFPNSNPTSEQSFKSFKSQPDLIPTEFHPKSRSNSNENLLEPQNLAGHAQPSPGTRRKAKAPPPPPPPPPAPPSSSSSSSSSSTQQIEDEQINNEGISSEQSINDSTSNRHLTGNQGTDDKDQKGTQFFTSKSVEESSSPSTQLKNIYKRFTRVKSSSSFNPIDNVHRRTPSGGSQLDRPGAPPPHPPSVVIISSPILPSKQRQSLPISNFNHEDNLSSSTEEKSSPNDIPTDSTNHVTPTNENVNVGKLISELNNRMAAARLNPTQSNNIRASHIRNSTITTPGETTDF